MKRIVPVLLVMGIILGFSAVGMAEGDSNSLAEGSFPVKFNVPLQGISNFRSWR